MKTRRRTPLLLAGFAVLAVLLGLGIHPIRWRLHVLVLRASGAIRDIELPQVISYMLPGSDQSLERLIDTRNPYAVIRNFRISAADRQAGGELFRARCAICHGPDGSGGPAAPPLSGRRFKNGESDWAVYRTIRLGVPNTLMLGHPLPDTETWQLVTFVRALDGATADHDAEVLSPPVVQVPSDTLFDPAQPAEDWLTYSGALSSTRHSTLAQINADNVAQLALGWIHPLETGDGEVQASPIVRRGMMFLTVPPNRVVAVDAATGRRMWTHEFQLAPGIVGNEFGALPNRGVAIVDDKVFFGTPDARLVALSAATGHVIWERAVSSEIETYYISSAPLVYRDLVVTGVGTRVTGRGFIVAFDATSGKERWRFEAIPRPGQPGNETWAGDSWRVGGAPTWLTGSYDPQLDLLYWGVGNPKPDYDAAVRRGDNLYSNSVVALRGMTGELVWHFQFTPADDHDWDSNQIPVLADVDGPEGSQKRLLWANRNGFYYVLDRETGRFLHGSPYAQQTWTAGLDANGRPQPLAAKERIIEGSVLYPGNVGATNWWSPSFDPVLKLFFVPTLEQGMVFFQSPLSPPKAVARSFYTAVRALEPSTGRLVWEHRREPRRIDNKIGGVLSTSGRIVFGADQTTFFALDSRSGEVRWSVETGWKIVAAPITYAVDGEQFVAITTGRNLLAFRLPRGLSRAPVSRVTGR
jgi:alcohol dehydrogenase (cytochrome c)